MNSERLDFYGVSIRLASESRPLLDELLRDFEYFRAETSGGPFEASLEFRHRAPEPRAAAGLRAPQYRVLDRGGARTVFYADGPVAAFDARAKTVVLECADFDRLRELAYLAVLSRAGEALDRRGLHRVHALGFESGGGGGLLLLPSGGGKSTLALALARRAKTGLLSEDTPIATEDGRLRAFPVRWAVRPDADLSGVPPELVRPFARRLHGPKKTVDLEYFRARVRDDVPARWLIVGVRSEGTPSLEPISSARALPAVLLHLVVGWGIPQMAEYMLRPGARLPSIALGRWKAARALLRSARCLRLRLGSSPDDAAALLERLR